MCECTFKNLPYYCEYYSCAFDLSVFVLPEYMCVLCVCVYMHGWVCVIAGFHTGFLLVGG